MNKPTNPPPKSLEAFAEARVKERFTENSDIARSARALRAANQELAREVTDLRGRLGLYERLAEERQEPPVWLRGTKSTKRHAAIPAMMLTDIHWGERVRPAEVDGMNCYNPRIAAQRVERAFTGAVRVTRELLAGMHYEGFTLLLGGDLLSGIIHEELRETNEQTVCESVVGVAEQVEAGINLLAAEFPKVHVAAVVGNHGRLTRKPRAKRRAQESLDWLVYKMLERNLRGRPTVTMQVADAADCRFAIHGHHYVLSHGDQFVGGSGISGALAPLLLGVHRKSKRDASVGHAWETLVIGHFHTSYFLKGLIVGGAVVGYSEYSYVNNLPYEEPQAALWLDTPERGITISAPVFVGNRTAEGWAGKSASA
jgi:hypothetical protein